MVWHFCHTLKKRLKNTVCIHDRTGSGTTFRTEVPQLWRYHRLSNQAQDINAAILKEKSRSLSTALKTWCASMTTVQLTDRTANTKKSSNKRAENVAKTNADLEFINMTELNRDFREFLLASSASTTLFACSSPIYCVSCCHGNLPRPPVSHPLYAIQCCTIV